MGNEWGIGVIKVRTLKCLLYPPIPLKDSCRLNISSSDFGILGNESNPRRKEGHAQRDLTMCKIPHQDPLPVCTTSWNPTQIDPDLSKIPLPSASDRELNFVISYTTLSQLCLCLTPYSYFFLDFFHFSSRANAFLK